MHKVTLLKNALKNSDKTSEEESSKITQSVENSWMQMKSTSVLSDETR